jgi:2TM domain-containing protein
MGILAGVSKTYTRREADEILRRALAVQPADGISHDDLVSAAREVGIPDGAIEAAAQQLGEDQRILERAALIRRRRRTAFLRHLLIYVVVNAGIFFVDRADGGAYWFQYPLIIWGVILAAVGIAQLAPDQRSLTRRAERELEREQRRAQRRMRAAARREGTSAARDGAKEFEAAVQEGVSSLLSAAARTIRGLSEAERFRVSDDGKRPRTAQESEAADAEPAAAGPAAARSRRHGD